MSATYLQPLRSLDLDGLGLIRYASNYLQNENVVDDVEQDIETLVLPQRSPTAALAMPVPPISAVLITAIYLRYIGQKVTTQNVLYTMHDYWRVDEVAALDLDIWRALVSAASDAHHAPEVFEEAGSYLATWVQAVLDSVADRFDYDLNA